MFLWRFQTKLPEGFRFTREEFIQLKVVRRERTEETSRLFRLRNRLTEAVFRVMPEEEASLGVGYLLGVKDGLSQETKELLALVGLSHIVVASGTHLGILVGFFKKSFGKISRFAGLLFSMAFIMLFGMMIDWTPSITRAGVVATVSLLLWYVGERARPMRVILFSMMVTLLVEPLYLFDLGWQLSFASFFGILVLAPLILELLYGPERPWLPKEERKKTEAGAITKTVVASVSATVMVAPILLYNFGSLSLISVVANVLILPTMAGVMGLVFLAGVFASGSGGLTLVGEVFGKIATWVIDYQLGVMRFCAERTEFLIQGGYRDFRVFLLYVPVLAGVIVGVFIRATKKRKATEKIRREPGKYLRWSRDVKREKEPET
ncbi:ComEC/Rec2 family competence protein [Candidatus Saccharibacteria bacterium]|nr:ComEC/Rec2 family competence protein [Candidatus Saccharibacteria bacterium]